MMMPGHVRPAALLTLAILLSLAIHAIAVVSPYDDAYITFRYVQNVEAGRGAVYNIGERVFGISTPLYGLWLTGLHRAMPGVDLPVLAVRGNGFFLAAAGLLSFLLLLRLGFSPWGSALAGAALVMSDGIVRASLGGMESSMFLALALGTAYASVTLRDGWALLLACLTALVRPEGILLVGLVLLARIADPKTRSLPLRLWWSATPLVLWLVAATAYYGSPIPHSIIAKSRPLYPLPAGAALRTLLRHAGDWTVGGVELVTRAAAESAGLTARWDRLFTVPILIGIGAVATAWGIAAWRRAGGVTSPRVLVLPAFLFSVLILYAITNPYLLPWYFPLIHAPWLLLILAAGARRPSADAGTGGARVAAGYLVTLLVCLAAFGPAIAHLGPSDWSLLSRGALNAKQSEIMGAYRRTADWVVTHSDSDETVAAPEIGMLGYHMDRKILDACGLVSEEAIPFLPVPPDQRGSQPGVISVDFVRATSPDLVVTLPTFARPSLARSDWFKTAYELVHDEKVMHGAGLSEGVLVFRRRGDEPPRVTTF